MCTPASLPKSTYPGGDSSGNRRLFHGLNIYEGLFISVSTLVNFSSSLASPPWPLVSIYSSDLWSIVPLCICRVPSAFICSICTVLISTCLFIVLGSQTSPYFPVESSVWLSTAVPNTAQLLVNENRHPGLAMCHLHAMCLVLSQQ